MNSEVCTNEQWLKWIKGRKITPINELAGFKVGDTVEYTNSYGVKFSPYTIIGIEESAEFYGQQIYLNKDSYWFPVHPSALKHI